MCPDFSDEIVRLCGVSRLRGVSRLCGVSRLRGVSRLYGVPTIRGVPIIQGAFRGVLNTGVASFQGWICTIEHRLGHSEVS